jgi:hypothetical protein
MKNPVQLTKAINPVRDSHCRSPLPLGLPRVQPIQIIRGFLLIPLALAWLALSLAPNAFGVSPAPDGGYANQNTAEGDNALFSLATGFGNTANGFQALYFNTTGNYNTAYGGNSLFHNTTINGVSGHNNTANGVDALFSNTTGSDNTASGFNALAFNTIGTNNTANGVNALYYNTSGIDNTANGQNALQRNRTGFHNTATGFAALVSNTTGSGNTADGENALGNNTTGFGNIALGFGAGNNVTTASHVICIGTIGNNLSNSCYIGQIFGQASTGGVAVFINSNGSSAPSPLPGGLKRRLSQWSKPAKRSLRSNRSPSVTKRGIDPAGTSQFGLVAEEVEKVNPDLVVRDKEGKPYSVRYEQVNAMLLNEFLKEHRAFLKEQRKVEAQEATITQLKEDFQSKLAEQQKQIKALTSGLEKVSAQVEVSKPAPRTVLNNQ